jgi:hypothetical protein
MHEEYKQLPHLVGPQFHHLIPCFLVLEQDMFVHTVSLCHRWQRNKNTPAQEIPRNTVGCSVDKGVVGTGQDSLLLHDVTYRIEMNFI